MPEGDLPRAQLVVEFDRLQRGQAGLVRRADGYPIHRVWVTPPFDPPFRYNLYSALVIVARHQLRHIVRAERVWQLT